MSKSRNYELWLGKVRLKYRYRDVLFGLKTLLKAVKGYSFAGYDVNRYKEDHNE